MPSLNLDRLPRPMRALVWMSRPWFLGFCLVACVPEGGPTDRRGQSALDPVEITYDEDEEESLPVVGAAPDPVLAEVYEDRFDRLTLGPDWLALSPAWVLKDGKLCVKSAKNRGTWLRRAIPANVLIEFDAVASTVEGDIKAEVFGDGRSGARADTYDHATGYVLILGGWQNSQHVLARLDEHGADRLIRAVDAESTEPPYQPVMAGETYRFSIRRSDGKTLAWSVNGVSYFKLVDPEPLLGPGHEHFGFNNWNAPVCFDNLRVSPMPQQPSAPAVDTRKLPRP